MKRERKSWEEEAAEVRRLARKMQVTDKWKFGFYQIIQDENPPTTKLKDNDFTEFLVPESHLSLKLYFDNLRNYAICAAFAALGAWVWTRAADLLPSYTPSWIPVTLAISTWIFVLVLLLLNGMQTWVLARELHHSIRAIRGAEFRVFRGDNYMQVTLSVTYVLIAWAVDLLVYWFAVFASALVIAISLGFVIYAVVGKQVPL